MMQILILPLIWRNKANYYFSSLSQNTKDNTRFLMWISNHCFCCIFQHNNMKTKAKSVQYFIIRFSPNGTLDIFEKMNDIVILIQLLGDIVKKQFQSKDVEYCIKCICCQMVEDKM